MDLVGNHLLKDLIDHLYWMYESFLGNNEFSIGGEYNV